MNVVRLVSRPVVGPESIQRLDFDALHAGASSLVVSIHTEGDEIGYVAAARAQGGITIGITFSLS